MEESTAIKVEKIILNKMNLKDIQNREYIVGVHTKIRDSVQYCEKCGNEVGIERCDFYFDKKKGNQRWNYRVYCYGFGRIFHPIYKFNDNGDEIPQLTDIWKKAHKK